MKGFHTSCWKGRINSLFLSSIFCTALLVISGITAAQADIWYVKTDGSDSNSGASWEEAFETIQAGMDAAVSGDTVVIGDGTYLGVGNKNLSFSGKAITVKSANGAVNCIIDCENDGRAFYLTLAESGASVIDGFTMKNGSVTSYGGAIKCEPASPTIKNCLFKNNYGGQWGGALRFWGGPPATVVNCIFAENRADLGGSGVSIYGTSPKFVNCTFHRNLGGSYGVIAIGASGVAGSFTNCIFWDNVPIGFHGTPTVTYSDVEGGYTGTGNMDIDPEFVDPDNGDFRLASVSDCIDAGNNDATGIPDQDIEGKPRFIDGDGDLSATVDMGTYEYGQICEYDYMTDLDTDGSDLVDFINDTGSKALGLIAEDYGRIDCPVYGYSPSIQ